MNLLTLFIPLNQVLTAGIAILSLSLWLYTLAFNLRNQVALAFSLNLIALTLIYGGEAMGSATAPESAVPLLRLSLLGIALLPATLLHFSDALLATTGRPSRGRRRLLVRLTYLLAGALMLLIARRTFDGNTLLVQPAPHLQPRPWIAGLALFYLGGGGWALVNIFRAYRRTVVVVSRRRMVYLLLAATFALPGAFPWLMLGSAFAQRHPWLFWLSATLDNLALPLALVLWAYSVAFFGTTWPDRVVRVRLLRWLLRGPITAATVLMLVTLVRRVGALLGYPYTAAVPITMVLSLLFLEHLIGLLLPYLEDALLALEQNGYTLRLLRQVEERIFTHGDLTQFVEALLAAVCDLLQTPQAFLAALENEQPTILSAVGGKITLPEHPFQPQQGKRLGELVLYPWNGYYILPLHAEDGTLIGLLGFTHPAADVAWDEDTATTLTLLAQRAVMALEDRRLQRQLQAAVEAYRRRTDFLPRLRAVARFDQQRVLSAPEDLPPSAELAHWVKDALSHYWGGPKLTENPLLNLEVVQRAAAEHDGNLIQGLRAVLRQAIETLRPEGERRFTTEWLLYNILDLKFLQGQRAREVAARLAVSEADLYRKQRIALQQVAEVLLEMERQAREEPHHAETEDDR